jgi:hypothetical protein
MPVVPAPRVMTPAAEDKSEPSFPTSARAETSEAPATPAAAADKDEEPAEEDAEAARRQTIAARMAKLGGVRAFGGPPPIPQPKRSVSSEPTDATSPVFAEAAAAPTAADTAGDDDEDDEARRARVRARMAAIGARGMGMFGAPAPPMTAPAPPAAEEAAVEPELASMSASAVEEVTATHDEAVEETEATNTAMDDDKPAQAEDVEGAADEEDDTPPPPPPPRKPSTLPPPPPPQEETEDMFEDEPVRADTPPPAGAVDISEEQDDMPPPPPRPSRGPPLPVIDTEMAGGQAAFATSPAIATPASPSRAQPSSPSRPTPDSPTARRSSTKRISGMFKTRSPSIDLRSSAGVGEDGVQQGSPTIPSPARPESAQAPPARRESAQTPTSAGGHADLQTLSRQTGSLVLRNAQSLLSQSKKVYIAVSSIVCWLHRRLRPILTRPPAPFQDGTSLGFVQEALQMSHCRPFDDGGITVFRQSNGTVKERRDDIQPGDMIELVRSLAAINSLPRPLIDRLAAIVVV